MIARLRFRQLAITAVVVVSFVFIYNAYSISDVRGKPIGLPHVPDVEADANREKEFDFKLIVSGQDGDKKANAQGGAKQSSGASSGLEEQSCRIPKLDINGAEVKEYFFKSEPLKCSANPANWVYIDDNRTVQYIAERKNAKCRGHYVTRKNDEANHYSAFDSLPSGKPLASDFAVVKCKDGNDKWSGILFSAVRLQDDKLLKKGSTVPLDNSGLNVFFLGFDSLSQMSFRRKLPQTVELLEKTLGSIVLNGYNIVGDGTPQAFIPILTSSTEEELPLTRKRFPNANYVDDVYPFIWNNFSSAGYATLYGEDAFAIGTFTYRLKGFRNQPTDHYLRTIFKEHEKIGGNCLGSEPLHKSWFRYSREFMNVYSDMPRFLLMHQGLLSHDDINLVEVEDNDLAQLLRDMHEKELNLQRKFQELASEMNNGGVDSSSNQMTPISSLGQVLSALEMDPSFALSQGLPHFVVLRKIVSGLQKERGELDNSVVIIMADHGHRFAKLRETHQGQLEEAIASKSVHARALSLSFMSLQSHVHSCMRRKRPAVSVGACYLPLMKRLPFFSIALPKAFRETEHGNLMYENLKKNKDRLTTPFDIHATLMDVLHLPKDLTTVQDTRNRSLSLFRPIPEQRTCAQAGVEPHWCTCLNWQDAMKEPGDRAVAGKLAQAVVEVINRQLKDVFHLCAKLSLKELIEAKKLMPNEDLLKYKNVKDKDGFVPDLSGNTKAAFAHYQIKLRTEPGDAIYEVTLFYDFKQNEVHIDLASISHPNKFGDAPHCIISQNYFLATYCVCHDKV